MGAWSTRIFDNDASMDVLTEYRTLLGYGMEPTETYQKISEYYGKDYIGQDDEDDYWLAIAYFQWKNGILMDEVKENALRCLEDDSFLERWLESGKRVYEQRKRTLEEFKNNLLNITNPAKKKFPKCPAYLRSKTPYKVGDIIVFKSNYVLSNYQNELFARISESSEKLKGKYFLLKVVDIEKRPVSNLCPELDYVSSAIAVLYDWVGDKKPNIEDVSGLHLKYFVDRATWDIYDFDTMKRLEKPYLWKCICYAFKFDSDKDLGNVNEIEVIGNEDINQSDFEEFRKKYPEKVVFNYMDNVLAYSFANYDNLKYD